MKTKAAPRSAYSNRAILAAMTAALVAVAAFAPRPCLAQEKQPPEKSVYQPAGAPADPEVPAQWNRYHDHAQATELLKKLVEAHPERCRLQSLGPSYGKREMWVMTITNFKSGKEEEKPAFWIDGSIHANEIQGSEVVLYTAWFLLESYDRSPLVKRLLDQRVFYLMPMMSPDSRDAHMYKPNSTNSPRSGQRPRDDDRDGLVDEDGPDDLDGDGNITQMRIKDPNGRWKPHPDFPEMMIQAKPDERGEYTLLGEEGIDNDDDGKINEDGDGYYDPNRNWPWSWQPEAVQHGSDRYPFSIEENRLVADFVMAHPNIAGAQSYHNAGGMILRGPGSKSDNYEGADVAVLTEIAKKGETMLPGYRSMETSHELYEVFGGEFDWFYAMQGILTFTNELFTPANFFRQKADGGGFFGKPEEQHLFNKYLLFGDGFVPWKEVEHPQFGKIEVGGFKKNWLRQPPSFLLEEECHRNMAFTLYHADQMPQVEVDSIQVKPLAEGLNQVTAIIINRKLTPTRAAIDVKHKITPPDRATIAGNNLQVIAGLTSESVLFEKPLEQKKHREELKLETVRGMQAMYARWIVKGPGPYTITVRSVKGGVAQRQSAP